MFVVVVVVVVVVAKKPKGAAPEFTKPLRDVEVQQGSTARLECRLTAKPEPTVNWLKEDQPVDTKRTKTYFDGELCKLTLMNTEPGDAGKYECVAQNENGSASSSASLSVEKAPVRPEITKKMKPLDVPAGGVAHFEVQVSGHPAPEVQWSKSGSQIRDGGRFKVSAEPETESYSLTIEDVAMDDFGSYKCLAVNGAGRAYCSARLEVTEKEFAPTITDDYGKAPVGVEEGKELKISVTVAAHPKPGVEWYKDGAVLRRNDHVNLTARGNKYGLVVLDALGADAGLYKFVAKNRVGSSTREIIVNVQGASGVCENERGLRIFVIAVICFQL